MSIKSEASELTPQELSRYDRHLSLPEVDTEGQLRLKNSRVLIIGAGGLGSPLGLYLAAAGIGTLGIVDFDRVDESNLQRQVLHGTQDVGELKTDSAKRRLMDLNPLIEVKTHDQRFTSDRALELVAEYDLVVDGTDNFPTRYLVNDACVLLKKPNVYGSIFRFEGQVSLFHPTSGGPCYRCLYAEPPPPHLVPNCAEGGVLGVLPGVVGSLQATEVVKYLLGIGESLQGRLLLFDALRMRFREMRIKKNTACALCGPNPSITSLVDYEEFCGLASTETAHPQVTPLEFVKEWRSGRRPRLIDVRQNHEWESSNLADYQATLMPLAELADKIQELNPEDDIVVHCKSGGRSKKAQARLLELGFSRVRNLTGGILRWNEEVKEEMRADSP